MRIIGGTAAGVILKAPPGLDLRPTPDLVKQALFNSLGERVLGRSVLELFAGTGALGLECLSRGATSLTSVEKSGRHGKIIRDNLSSARLSESDFQLRVQDAFVALHQLSDERRVFDLVLADPPYGDKNIGRRSTSFAQQLIDDPALPRLLAPQGIFILGHSKRDTLSISPDAWQETKLLKHGDSIIRFLTALPR